MSEDITSNAIPSYPAEAPRRAPRFDVEPYQPDGVAPPGGLAFLMVGVLGTAAALGLVLSYAVEQFYLILVFPLLAGALLGGAGRALVRAGRVRSPAVAATVAALGGVAMMFFMHYFDYLHNLNNPGWQGAGRQRPGIHRYRGPGGRGRRRKRQQRHQPRLRRLVPLLRLRDDPGGGRRRRHRAGSALDPFCRNCNGWKTGRTLAGLPHVPQHVAVEAVEAGALLDLLETGVPMGRGHNSQFLKVVVCPRCSGEGTVVAMVERITTDSRGRRSTKRFGKTVYPGEVLARIDEHSPWLHPRVVPGAENSPPETRREDIRPV